MTVCVIKRFALLFFLSLLLTAFSVSPGQTGESGMLEQTKAVLSGVEQDGGSEWIEEKTGQYLNLESRFVDGKGSDLSLGDIIDRPTILLPIYFYCPNICSRNLSNLAIALQHLNADPQKDFRVIALSFNEVESPQDAARAKRNYLKIAGDDFPADSWYFLTGKREDIKATTDGIGFRFKKVDDETFIHPAALVILGADGQIIRYVYGSFLSGDIDVGLLDAGKNQPSLSVKRLLGFCFNYDPDKNKSVFQSVKIGVFLFFGVALTLVFFYFKKRRPKNSRSPGQD